MTPKHYSQTGGGFQLHMIIYLTMVFQAPRALTTMPKGYTDAALSVEMGRCLKGGG